MPGKGTAFAFSTPAKYGRWLTHACQRALGEFKPAEQLVFINAWNEWGEGAYLEPDRHFGFAYLQETAAVLSRLDGRVDRRAELAASPNDKRSPSRRFPSMNEQSREFELSGSRPSIWTPLP